MRLCEKYAIFSEYCTYFNLFQVRGAQADLPKLTDDLVKTFLKRHSLGKLRKASSDRFRSTGEQLREDNTWRDFYDQVVQHPDLFGLAFTDGASIPAALQLGADETPVLYMPEVRGTYDMLNSKQIQIMGSRERRMITGTPVTNRQGDLVLMQMLWKGKTSQVLFLCPPTSLSLSSSFSVILPELKLTLFCIMITAQKRCRPPVPSRYYWTSWQGGLVK